MSELFEILREDMRYCGGDPMASGFHALAVHRLGVWLATAPLAVRLPGRVLHRALLLFVRNVYGIDIPPTVTMGRRVVIGHQSGIVVHPRAVIGDGCFILQNCTLAGPDRPTRSGLDAPHLGNDVRLGAGAVIIGGVTIGDGARIGPNVVVTTDIPAGATVVVDAPRVIRRPGSAS